MRPSIFFLLLVAFSAASSAARAQLIHWSYSGTARYAEPGEGWFAPGELNYGLDPGPLTPARIDVTFNSQLTPSSLSTPDLSIYFPALDPSGNAAAHKMRLQFGAIDLTVPIDKIHFYTGAGTLIFYGLNDAISLSHGTVPSTGPFGPLPTTFGPETWRIGFFVVTVPEGHEISPGFFEADINEVRVFAPVPEPAAFGVAAAALLGCFVFHRFSNKHRPIRACASS